MKIARYELNSRGLSSPIETVGQWHDFMDGHPEYVRLSEIVEIELPPLKDDQVIEKQLAAIDLQEQTLRNEFQRRLDEFNERRANLRALTHSA